TAVAGIERGIGLDDLVDDPAGRGGKRATEGGDNARGHASGQTERVAPGDDELPDAKTGRVAKLNGRGDLAPGVQNREVGQRIAADDIDGHGGAIREQRLGRPGTANDVCT